MARRSKISVEFMQKMVSLGKRKEAYLFAVMKSTEGMCIRKELYDRRTLKSLRAMDLVGYSPRTREYYQRSTQHAHGVLGLKSCTFNYITQKQLFKYDVDALAYSMSLQYMLRYGAYPELPVAFQRVERGT